MYALYLTVTAMAAAANLFSAGCDFARFERVAVAMDQAGVPQSWMTALGTLKAAGALGLLAGIALPALGIAAATGLVLFFLGAIAAHVRGRYHDFGLPVAFLALAAAALVLRIAA
ncbi:DoxX family protein [Catellatospora sichuanensis]|uniref:DoxX family protein n=1 Tax=Catellatospora sichuanensis TaxID=1969805 RepID=UPI0011844AEE|nr:DoxX family protein [Catellatospora sichuanensis]